jgi:hypothetical protein
MDHAEHATFAFGTAAGDMTAATLHLGFFASLLVFAVLFLMPWLGYLTHLDSGVLMARWGAVLRALIEPAGITTHGATHWRMSASRVYPEHLETLSALPPRLPATLRAPQACRVGVLAFDRQDSASQHLGASSRCR